MMNLRLRLRNLLIWDQSINFLLNQFSPLIICSLINLTEMRFEMKEKASMFSSALVITVLIMVTIALIALFRTTYSHTKIMDSENIDSLKKQFPKLYEGLKFKKEKLIIVWKPLNLIR